MESCRLQGLLDEDGAEALVMYRGPVPEDGWTLEKNLGDLVERVGLRGCRSSQRLAVEQLGLLA